MSCREGEFGGPAEKNMIRNLLKRKRPSQDRAGSKIPEGTRIYAIGDIHGRVDLVRKMHGLILRDSADAAEGARKVAVFLGDYIDRGMQSRQVIDLLIDHPLPGFETIHLRGNHEDSFRRLLDDASIGRQWFSYGGDATVYSYGVRIPRDLDPVERFAHIQKQLRERVPSRHVEFLDTLKMTWKCGDYLFVHAGIRPGVPLELQSDEDMLWIRDAFTESNADHGRIVVHGHSITEKPDIRNNRIGIDTGAYASNVLTCLVLEGTGRRFLTT
jgi:serine/threonine protein phosphatase 1